MFGPEQDWDSAGQTLSPVAPCPQPRTQDISSKEIGQPIPCALALFRTHDLSPWLAMFAAYGFLQQMFQVPSISKTLWSLLQLQPHFHSFMCYRLRAWLQGLLPCDKLPGFPSFPLESQWNLPWSHNSCIVHACKTSTMWMMPQSAASWSTGHASLGHGYSGL
jgi:hypothetical protein